VALKTGRFAIADYLIERGADVNFMEESAMNEWRTPALHDAIRAAVFSTGVSEFAPAIGVIRKMLQRGADPNAADSYGNNCLMRAILDARMRIRAEGPSVSPRLMEDVGEIFKMLIQAGADVHARGPDRASAVEETRGSLLEQFVKG
jgi:ankyrin repeat protein